MFDKFILKLNYRGFLKFFSDKTALKILFKAKMGYKLNLNDPITFNEKLQWLKLYDRKDEYTNMVDKYEVKKIIGDKIGEQYVIPTFGVWDSFDEIDFSSLPEQFVLKCTHDSGGLVICKDKSCFDFNYARKKISKCLKKNYYYLGREWPYKNVKPRIIAEKYMINDSEADELSDYKIFCFDGNPEYIYLHTGRFNEHRMTVFDCKWVRQNISQAKDYGAPPAEYDIPKPALLEEMLEKTRIISKGICHVRVDWYISGERLYFGEITFFDGSGFDSYDEYDQDLMLGKKIKLPR